MPTGQQTSTIINFQAVDENAFDDLFRTHYPALCFFAQRFLKDEDSIRDLVQTCFVKLWRRRTFLSRPEAIKSYLYSTVRNACIDELKIRKKEKENLQELTNSSDAFSPEELDEVVHAELIRDLKVAMEVLPPKIIVVIKKVFEDGKSCAEIADEFNVSPKTIHKQRKRGIELLKGLFFW